MSLLAESSSRAATAADGDNARVTPTADVAVWTPERRPLTIGLVATVTLVAFEAMAVATVMPLAGEELGSVELYGWTFTAYFLASMLGIVGAGAAVDRYGVRLPFIAGVAVFALGLAIGGVALSMPMLVAGRAVQGIGGGVLTPVAYVMIARGYPETARPKMFAILSSAWVVPALVGPAVAGSIGDNLSWRLVFLGLLPIIALAGALTVLAVRRLGDQLDGAGAATDARDGAGRLARAVVTGIGATVLLTGLGNPVSVVSAALIVAGIVIGLPAVAGLLPAGSLVSRRGLPAAIFSRAALAFAFFGAEAYLPLALVAVRGTTAFEAGLALTASALSWAAGSWIQARKSATWGEPRLVQLGFALVLVGTVTTAAVLHPAVPVYVAIGTWAIVGLGMGLAYASTTLVVLRTAAPSEQGRATSALSLAEVIGVSVGTGLGGASIAATASAGLSPVIGLAGAFAIAAVVAALGGLLAHRLAGGAAMDARPGLAAVESTP